jgi:hypothetical protein
MICYKFIATDGWTLILRFSDRCLTLQIGCGIVGPAAITPIPVISAFHATEKMQPQYHYRIYC